MKVYNLSNYLNNSYQFNTVANEMYELTNFKEISTLEKYNNETFK